MPHKDPEARRAYSREYKRRCPQDKAKKAAWREAHREENARKERERRARNLAIVQLAKDKPCVDCGHKFHPVAMDLDHVRGVKVKNVSLMIGGNTDRLLEEIAKCDVRCAVCHRIKHYAEGGD